jgi:hypothetical protein
MTTVLVYDLARRFGLPERRALASALASLVLPISGLFWATLASETLFSVLLLAGLTLSWAGAPDANARWAAWSTPIGAGLAAGLMTLTRPIGVLLLPALAVGLLWPSAGQDESPPRKPGRLGGSLGWGRMALGALACCAVLAPWWWRNTRLYGRPLISTVGSVNLLTYNVAAMLARRQGLGFWEGRYLVWEYWDAYYAGLAIKPTNEVEDADAMRQAAMQVIRASPLEFAWVNTVESLNSLRPGVAQVTVFLQPGVFDETTGEGDISPVSGSLSQPLTRALAIGLTGIYGAVYLLTVAGAGSALARRRWPLLLGAALPVAILLMSPGPVANSRFRVPAEPLMGILVMEGVAWLTGVIRRRLRNP